MRERVQFDLCWKMSTRLFLSLEAAPFEDDLSLGGGGGFDLASDGFDSYGDSGGTDFTGDFTDYSDPSLDSVTGSDVSLDTSVVTDPSSGVDFNTVDPTTTDNSSLDSALMGSSDFPVDATGSSYSYDSSQEVPGTGQTIGDLQAAGWTDQDIQQLLSQEVVAGSGLTVGDAMNSGLTDQDIGNILTTAQQLGLINPNDPNAGPADFSQFARDLQQQTATAPSAASGRGSTGSNLGSGGSGGGASMGGGSKPSSASGSQQQNSQLNSVLSSFQSQLNKLGSALTTLLRGGNTTTSQALLGQRLATSSVSGTSPNTFNLTTLLIVGAVISIALFWKREG